MSKLIGVKHNIQIHHTKLRLLGNEIMQKIGCSPAVASEISDHLVDADLSGIHSHGTIRLSQYVQQYKLNLWTPSASPILYKSKSNGMVVDGQDCIGIVAVRRGVQFAVDQALDKDNAGIACIGVMNCGHTGRIGVFAEEGARRNCLTFVIGGGSRKKWRQVAPFGGTKGLLPTNPYAISIPGDVYGPVTIDFATGATAGGWVMAANKSNATLKKGLIIDQHGRATVNPKDYINGGALLPAAGSKGYGLGLMAELIAYTMLGEVTKEAGLGLNTFIVAVDTSRFRNPLDMLKASSEILKEVRACPPDVAGGFEKVEVPGQRENEMVNKKMRNGGYVDLPEGIWNDIVKTAVRLGVENVPNVEVRSNM